MNAFKTILMMFLTVVAIFAGVFFAGKYYYSTLPTKTPIKAQEAPRSVKKTAAEQTVKKPEVFAPAVPNGQITSTALPAQAEIPVQSEAKPAARELLESDYEKIYSNLSEGDQFFKTDDNEQALAKYLEAYQASIGSGLERVAREKLLWLYQKTNEDALALEQVEWLLPRMDRSSPLFARYAEMKNYLTQRVWQKRISAEQTTNHARVSG